MKLITDFKDSHFAIPVNRIDWIRMEDAAGGRVLIKIGTGGTVHHYNYDDKESGEKFYNDVVQTLEEL